MPDSDKAGYGLRLRLRLFSDNRGSIHQHTDYIPYHTTQTMSRTRIGEKHYASLAQGVSDLQRDTSLDDILTASERLIAQLRNMDNSQGEGQEAVDVDIGDVKELVERYQIDILELEKSANKEIKTFAARVEKCKDWSCDDVYRHQSVNVDTEGERQYLQRAIVVDLLSQGEFDKARLLALRREGEGEEKDAEEETAHYDDIEALFKNVRGLVDAVRDGEYSVVYQWALENAGVIGKVTDLLELLRKLIYFQVLEIKAGSVKMPDGGNLLIKVQQEEDSQIMNRIKDVAEENLLPVLGAFDKQGCVRAAVQELNKGFWIVQGAFGGTGVTWMMESPLLQVVRAGLIATGGIVDSEYGESIKVNSGGHSSGRRKSSSAAAAAAVAASAFRQREKGNDSGAVEELGLDLDVPAWAAALCGGHRVFVCPVLREETTAQNGAVALSCGHLLSRQALDRLAGGHGGFGVGSGEVKCVYCPERTSVREARSVQFL